jgi:hypothetical protein
MADHGRQFAFEPLDRGATSRIARSPISNFEQTGALVKVYSMPAIGHRNVTVRLRGLAGVE